MSLHAQAFKFNLAEAKTQEDRLDALFAHHQLTIADCALPDALKMLDTFEAHLSFDRWLSED